MAAPRLRLEHTALLVVDMQEKLLPHIHDQGRVAQQVGRLIDGFAALGRPIVVTEQYRKGLGVTVKPIADRLPAGVANVEKLKFSAWVEGVREALAEHAARSVVVCGIESHVCVLQTCLDAVDQGVVTAVAVDAIGSRRPADHAAAVSRLSQLGVLTTTAESALLEMVGEAGGAEFKRILPIIRDL